MRGPPRMRKKRKSQVALIKAILQGAQGYDNGGLKEAVKRSF
ncbi:hypothetical protein LEP1GSC047_3748 [Leptospira inadai serovar Lyme str. 10]|uniref:Uncharacterized protein n=1 Tax=Leptospira inadai serovar Lyme str. 10 TaxID=1049790 RepID=V6HY77_9LEPT|nr:hypothetical protein LEP1GSC047_3748 [Leptospira inadai serovar Lyme str. 10]